VSVEELRDVKTAADLDVAGTGQRCHRHERKSYAADRPA
jgi:hypothetical protein